MRRILFWFALLLVGGALLAWLMEQETGYLLIAVGQTTIEMNLWAALLALVLVWGVVKILLRVLRSLAFIKRWRAKRINTRRQQTASGLIFYLEGQWGRARRDLLRGAGRSDMPLVNYLAAANAAAELGNPDEVQELLLEAEKYAPVDSPAIGLTQARLLLKSERYEDALAVLQRLRDQFPEHSYVLTLLVQAYKGLQDWKSLDRLLPQLKQQRIFDKHQRVELEQYVYANLMMSEAARAGSGQSESLQNLWRELPSSVRQSPQVVLAYSHYLQAGGESEKAEKLLSTTINRYWDDQLVHRYGLLDHPDVSKPLVVAEAWLRERPNNPVLLLTLGRLAQRAQLWGKARDYLESSLAISAAPETYAELARLMAQLGDSERSANYYQQGLIQSAQN